MIIYLSFFILASLEDLYCFNYQESEDTLPQHAGWNFFNVQSEFQRQGVPNEEWSLSYLNTNYEVYILLYFYSQHAFSILNIVKSCQFFQLCDTYPRYLYVPSTCTNNILLGSAKFRSRGRLPVLTYLHSNKVKKDKLDIAFENEIISNKIIFF